MANEYSAKSSGILPYNITSYDLLKILAVVTMVIDHVGYYFYEDVTWWRVAGRLSFPVWAFLVGYARSRDLSWRIWAGAFALVLADMAAGQGTFPLNILFSIILIRLLIDSVMRAAAHGFETLSALCAVIFFSILPTSLICEYGTQGLLLAMFGYIMRNRPEIEDIRKPEYLLKGYALFALSQYFFLQSMLFEFDLPQMVALGAGLMIIFALLYEFRPQEFPRLTGKLPDFAAGAVRFLGRKTLEIYVAHLILFKILGLLTDPERFQLFQWKWALT